jgi:hypothetical protein
MRDCYRDELLGLGWRCPIREHLLVERLEGVVDFGGEPGLTHQTDLSLKQARRLL